jgi:alpha-D-xyloside xylohydrolase
MDKIDLELRDKEPFHIRISCEGTDLWRIKIAGEPCDLDATGAAQQLAEELGETPACQPASLSSSADNGTTTVSSPSCSSEVRVSGGKIAFIDENGEEAFCLDGIAKADSTTTVTAPLDAKEKLFGTGERFNTCNQRGKRVRIWAEDRWTNTEGNSYAPIPFVMSSRGYALFLNRFQPSEFDLGKSRQDQLRISLDKGVFDLYVMPSASPSMALSSLAGLTGHAPLPPEWAFGVIVSRHSRTREMASLQGVRDIIDAMEKKELPWTTMLLEGWRAYNTETHSDLATLAAEIHARGKKVMLYEPCGRFPVKNAPGAGDGEDFSLQKYTANSDYFVKDNNGNIRIAETRTYNPADAPGKRRSCYLDITNPAARKWWFDDIWGALVRDIGADGAKIDFCEQFPDSGLHFSDGRSADGMHHLHPVLYNTMMYRYYNRVRPEGGVCWSRGGGIGTQRYPFLWTGDQLREWKYLQVMLTGTLSSGLSGIPFVGHDAAGYMPANDAAENPEPEVFVRGIQMACFTVCIQTHGIVTPPWNFESPYIDLYRLYANIHYTMLPYIVEQARISTESGMPLIRHLFLHYPSDTVAGGIEDQYMFGEGLLVAPVLHGGESRKVYLPEGSWVDLNDETEHQGSQTITDYRSPLWKTPLFINTDTAGETLLSAAEKVRKLLSHYNS